MDYSVPFGYTLIWLGYQDNTGFIRWFSGCSSSFIDEMFWEMLMFVALQTAGTI